ncbi:MAG: hypothetical protein KDA85_14220, partial [Planctomycetaceae bacterium]|nr:hypothetical protein [Planctomycetaceae bacterium]
MALTIDGLITGIDTQSILDGLQQIQQQQIDRMKVRQTEVTGKQTAFKTLEAQLLSLRADIGVLNRNASSPFTRQSVTVSDESAVAATAGSTALPGTYRLTVDRTASTHQVASQGFADADSEITQGTFDIRLGGGDVKTITVNSNNNSLSGFADAINSAGAGVTATVVKD